MTLTDHIMKEAIELQKQSNLKGKKHLREIFSKLKNKYYRFSDKEKADSVKEWDKNG